ncbi:MAG: rolling circle replication-associated protein [Cellulosilyticaceae bacterium]
MPCTRPLTAYWTGGYTKNGKRELVFTDPRNAHSVNPIEIACGQCIHCRLQRSRETALRAVHEAREFENNCFITLTVAPEYMDEVFPDGSLDHRPFQLFAKRLRKKFKGLEFVTHPITKKVVNPIRILMCGEYGEQLNRPHYHACLFNFDFPDKKLWTTRNGVKLYRSEQLEKLWPYGYSTIGEVNFESAAYLARYVTKKITGEQSDEHYTDPETGVLRKKEYIVFPSGYGLGRLFYEEYKDQMYANDVVLSNKGHKMKPPRYYDKIYDLTNPEDFAKISLIRIKKGVKAKKIKGLTPERLQVIERVKVDTIKNKLKRGYEGGY